MPISSAAAWAAAWEKRLLGPTIKESKVYLEFSDATEHSSVMINIILQRELYQIEGGKTRDRHRRFHENFARISQKKLRGGAGIA